MTPHPKLPLAPSEQFIRTLCLFAFIPALILVIIAGVVGHTIFPLLLIIPLSLTLFPSLAFWYLARHARKNHVLDPAPAPKGARRVFINICTLWLWPVVDLAHALTYLGLLIGLWVHEARVNYYYWGYRNASTTILVAYATVFPLFNMVVHFYFAIVGIFQWLLSLKASKPTTCDNCGHTQGLVRRAGPSMVTKKVGDGVTYSLLGERSFEYDDDSVRASMESGPSQERPSQERPSQEMAVASKV